GLERLDVEAVRAAAKRARDVGKMLTPQLQERIGDAIKIARATARKIAKAGETAAIEVDLDAVRRVADARAACLDLDAAADPIIAPPAEGLALDLEPAALEETVKSTLRPALDLE